MCHIENFVLKTINPKPNLYLRYVDDIFVDVDGEEQLEKLRMMMEKRSCLRFTVERCISNKIPFLDVWVDGSEGTFKTSVYRKPSNSGKCLNGDSECPMKYKTSVIRAYVSRAFKICSDWPLLHHELNRIRQILTNNGYSMVEIDREIKTKMSKFNEGLNKQNDSKNPINIFYQNTFSSS